jgi:hypothetical protein
MRPREKTAAEVAWTGNHHLLLVNALTRGRSIVNGRKSIVVRAPQTVWAITIIRLRLLDPDPEVEVVPDPEPDPEPEVVFDVVPVPVPVDGLEDEPNGARRASVAGPAAVCLLMELPDPDEGLSDPTAQIMLVEFEGVESEGSVKVMEVEEEFEND